MRKEEKGEEQEKEEEKEASKNARPSPIVWFSRSEGN